MKKLLFLFALAMLVACSADYDTFGTSDYNALETISFEEQDGSTSSYSNEHKMIVNLKAVPDSLKAWDSVTVSEIDGSSLATLHLVESKFKEFPSDSAALDSLANEVSYESKRLKVGSKVRLPESHVLYVLFVSESGIPAIWQLTFNIPGEDSSKDEDDPNDGEDEGDEEISSSSESGSSSSSAPNSSSSSVIVLNSSTNFMVSFENQLKQNLKGDTLEIKFVYGSIASVEEAKLKDFSVAEGATVDPDPSKTSWAALQSFEVTAEDGTKKNWFVALSIAEDGEKASSEKELISISAKGEVEKATVDASAHSVILHFATPSDLDAADISIQISESALHNLDTAKVNLRDGKTFSITAEDGSSEEWTLSADYLAVAPEIKSLSIAGKPATIDGDHIHVDDLTFLTDLTSLAVTELSLSEGATANIKVDSKYDFSSNYEVVVTNGAEEKKYSVIAGYQLPGSDMNTWKSSGVMMPDSVWGNANMVGETTSKYSSGSIVGAQIKTNNIIGKIASGSLYTAEFNPNGVGTLAMASSSTWPDGNELLDFGKKFKARPAYLDVKFKYTGSGDSCDVYILLENRTGDLNRNRKSTDVNKLVASAWYRSTTADNTGRKNPDVVSVSAADANGFRTIRLKLQYGSPLAGSPIEVSSVFNTKLESKESKAIDNSLIQGTGNEAVTHIRLVFASSADGNHYKGKSGATLIVDEVKLVY